jgi:ankyrin repeat protein
LAQLHLDSLKGKKSRKAVRTTLQNLPTGSEAYDYAYDEAMARIEAQLQDEKILAKQVLQWISTAVQPLKTVELEHALAIEIGESCLDEDNICAAEDMVSVCAGLVTIDPESGIVRLVHFTTQQYFDRSRSKWFGDANMDITKACMTYLLFDEFGNGPCENEDMVRQRRRSYPFYDYAAANWGHHAKQCGSDGVKLTDMYKHPQHVDSMSQALMAKIYWPLKVGFEDQFAKGMTGLHMAAFFHFQEMAEHYLNQGVPPDCPDSHQRTPLCWAAMQGDVGIVKLLIDTGKVDPLKKDNDSRSPFSWAAQGGFMEIVKLFLESNFDLDPNEVDDYGWSPLSWACEYGREEMVKLLLSLPNVNSNSTDNSGRTPLSWAAEKGHKNIVQMLIDATGGIDADSADTDGWTPLSWAADCGHNDVMQVLIDSVDARPEVIDGEGRATLSRVAQYGHNHTVKFLLDFPQVQVSRKHESGRTALSYAAQYGHYNVVKTLLEAAIGDVDLADNQGWTHCIGLQNLVTRL